MRNNGQVGVMVALGALMSAAAALGGCAGNKAVSNPTVVQLEQPDALIQMRRAGCVADPRCPVYSVSVFADGTVAYDGRANVAVIGQRREKISPERLADLVSKVEATGFLDAPEQCCVCLDSSDSAGRMVLLDYRPGGVAKSVVNDDACRTAPASIRDLERAIDDATAIQRWTVGPASAAPRAAVASTDRHSQP